MIDLMMKHFGTITPTKQCLEQGHVTLLDMMPRITHDETKLTADYAVLDAARISYTSNQSKQYSVEENRGLIRYLMRNSHTTPFEMVEFKFGHKLPIFVARQLVRHRMVSLNEMSGRYSQLPREFYVPEEVRQQSKSNKQSSEGSVDSVTAEEFLDHLEKMYKDNYAAYEKALKGGVGKEVARIGLPVAIYTQWVWKIDLHNLLHFLKLRCDSHAQMEIKVYADAMLEMLQPLVPWTIEAWEDFDPYRKAITLSRLEVDALKNRVENSVPPLSFLATKREKEEWTLKALKLGFGVKDAQL